MLIIENRQSVEVYVNDLIQITIRHPDVDEAIVCIHPDDIEKVIAALISAYKDAKAMREEPDFSLDALYKESD